MELEHYGRYGPKAPVMGKTAVCASQHPIVTETMLQVMKDGGNAVDAAIAGSIVQGFAAQTVDLIRRFIATTTACNCVGIVRSSLRAPAVPGASRIS